ncbi:SspB family protein [Erythrobacter sp. W53]|uniref:SspB family protein n=1 Tax=Erythrobacteraceae TaxID=335929 RepID=UPI0036D2825F
MSEETPDSLIPYDSIVQEALRAVVGRVLGEIQASGSELPGNHHFYITFKTHAPGVSVPPSLRERFPDEMTIVLQNKFWDLKVEEEQFSVGLSFNQIPADLVVPYAAITQFVDPAVDFGLQFQATAADMGPATTESPENDQPGQDEADTTGTDDGSNVVTVDFGRKK